MKALLALTVAAGLAAGLFWPTQSGTRPAPAATEEMVLYRSPDRHFYADGKVDGKPIRFLVDTGSSAVALTEKDARKLGIEVETEDYEVIGEGASGLVRGKYVDVGAIELGDIRKDGIKIAVVEGARISLLGQPFLEQLDEIVVRKDRMILRAESGS